MMACVFDVMTSHALDNLRKGRIKWRQKKKKTAVVRIPMK